MEVYIDFLNKEANLKLLSDLELHKEQIHAELGQTLDWQPLEARRACRIALVRPGSIEDDNDTLADIQSWMIDNLLKFKQVFGPRLAELTQ